MKSSVIATIVLGRQGCKKVLFYTSLFLFILFGCSSSDSGPEPQPAEKGNISGKVTDQEGRAYPRIRIVASKGSETSESITNANGEYSINTQSTGSYQVELTLPLATNGNGVSNATVQANLTTTVNFTIEPESLDPVLVFGNADIFGEIKNQDGNIPVANSEALYAANVFDPPFGLLTPIEDPADLAVTLGQWKQAQGSVLTHCSGNTSQVAISLEGLIPGGTYTFWLNFLNKTKTAGQSVDLLNDVVSIDPLGAPGGTENIAIADSEGNIEVDIAHGSCVLTKEAALVLVIIYHINGNTYGPQHIPDPEEVNHMLAYFQ
jgi:hypothetical protein